MSDDRLSASAVEDQQVIQTDEQPAAATKTEQEQRRAVTDFQKNDEKTSIRVKVYSPFRDYYDGLAFSLSAANATGPFDILPHHHNFISLLLPCELIIRTVREGERRIQISGGIIHVKADELVVFLNV